MTDPTDAAIGLIESCRGLRTEIDRLRAALQKIVDYDCGASCSLIARRALGGKSVESADEGKKDE